MYGGLDTKLITSDNVRRKNRWHYDAEDHIAGLKMLDGLNEMLPITRVKDTMEYCEEHPYWREKGAQELARRVLEAQLRLLEIVWPEKFPAEDESLEGEAE